jgi:tetratricopeptide (TPR) repeat protein
MTSAKQRIRFLFLVSAIWAITGLNITHAQEPQLRPEGIIEEYGACTENCEALFQECLEYISSLEKGTDSGRALMMLSEMRRDKGLWDDEVTKLYEQAKRDFKKANDYCGLAQAHSFEATFYSVLGNLDKSIELSEQSLRVSEKCDLKIVRAAARKALGYALSTKGEYKRALKEYSEAYNIYAELKDPEGMGMATQEMAAIYGSIKEFAKNKEMMLKAAELYKEAGANSRYAGCIIDLCANFLSENQPDSVFKYIPEAIELIEGEWHVGEAYAIYNLGEAHKQKRQWSEALEAYDRASELTKDMDHTRFKSEIALSRSEVYTGMGLHDLAFESAMKAREISSKYFDVEGELNVLQFLMYTAHDVGEHEISHEAALDFIHLNDSLRGESRQKEIIALQEEFEAERKEHQIEMLEAETALADQKRKGLLIIIGLLLIAASLVINREIQRRKKVKLLHETEIKLREAEEMRLREEIEHKNRELASKALHISQKNEVLEQLRKEVKNLSLEHQGGEAVRGVMNTLRMEQAIDNNWEEFTQQFKELNPEFYKRLESVASEMTKNDYRLAALLRMNLNSKEIASILNISNEGVKKARQRFRKKLDIGSDENLDSFIVSL